MRDERFPTFYFMFYPLFGPLLGFIGWAGVIIFVNLYNNDLQPGQIFGPEGLGDMYWMIPIAYILGIVPATLTGIHAAKSVRKNGKSTMVETLLASFLANLFILLLGALAFGFGFFMFGVVLIPAGLFAALVIKGVEIMFFQRTVSDGAGVAQVE